MELKFLKAGTGDSILIHHKKFNILIDGGNDSQYLLPAIDKIFEKGEVIDLLVITHHDDDHIKGIIDLLKHIAENKYSLHKKFIKQTIFNSPRLLTGKISEIKENETLLSYKQANEVEDHLLRIDTDWKKYTVESESIIFEDLKIVILSPTKEILEEYSPQESVYLTSDYRCDWKTSMAILDKSINDDSQDKSIPNKTSLVLQLECEGKRILLTGDVTPVRFNAIIDNLFIENGRSPVNFDVIKLPHHGSYRSLSQSILQKIKCTKFVISTNGKKHFLPNKRALIKVLKFVNRNKNQTIDFIFNYEETINKLEIKEQDKIAYNFTLTSNNNNYYGISI